MTPIDEVAAFVVGLQATSPALILKASAEDEFVTIDWFEVKPAYRGQGIARDALTDIIMVADELNVELRLRPVAMSEESEDEDGQVILERFYKSCGFMWLKGHSHDGFDDWMVRPIEIH